MRLSEEARELRREMELMRDVYRDAPRAAGSDAPNPLGGTRTRSGSFPAGFLGDTAFYVFCIFPSSSNC